MTGSCLMCPPGTPPRKLVSGLCQYHYWPTKRKEFYEKKKQEQLQVIDPKSLISKLITADPPEPNPKTLLQQYYRQNVALNIVTCENCKEPIPWGSLKLRICSIAHIIPKNKFHSVMAHPLNKLHLCSFLSGNDCHYKWDYSWDRAQRMSVLPVALERFDQFKHLISPSEYRHLPDFLRHRL